MAMFGAMLASSLLPAILPGILGGAGGMGGQAPQATATAEPIRAFPSQNQSGGQDMSQQQAFQAQQQQLMTAQQQQLATAQAQLAEQKAEIDALKGGGTLSPALVGLGVGGVLLAVYLLR